MVVGGRSHFQMLISAGGRVILLVVWQYSSYCVIIIQTLCIRSLIPLLQIRKSDVRSVRSGILARLGGQVVLDDVTGIDVDLVSQVQLEAVHNPNKKKGKVDITKRLRVKEPDFYQMNENLC